MAKLRTQPRVIDNSSYALRALKSPSLSKGAVAYARLGTIVLARRLVRQVGAHTDARRIAQLWFLYMNLCYVLLHSYFRDQFAQQSIKTFLTARDIFFAAAAGTLYSFDDSLHKYYPYRFVMSVSDSLDSIEQTAFSLLYRGRDRWRGLRPGQNGYVLSMTDEGPAWSPAAGSARVVSFDGGNLGGTMQGMSTVLLSGGRLGLVLASTGTYGVSCGCAIPLASSRVSIRAYIYSYSTSGGDLDLTLSLSVTNADGVVITSPSQNVVVPQPISGATSFIEFGPFTIFAVDEMHCLHFRIQRNGTSQYDTSTSPVALFRVTVMYDH